MPSRSEPVFLSPSAEGLSEKLPLSRRTIAASGNFVASWFLSQALRARPPAGLTFHPQGSR
jgi:hypothetical protein